MNKWNNVEWVVFILTIVISIAIVAVILRPYFTGIPLSNDNGKLLTSIVASIIAIISMFVGSKINNKNKDCDNKK